MPFDLRAPTLGPARGRGARARRADAAGHPAAAHGPPVPRAAGRVGLGRRGHARRLDHLHVAADARDQGPRGDGGEQGAAAQGARPLGST